MKAKRFLLVVLGLVVVGAMVVAAQVWSGDVWRAWNERREERIKANLESSFVVLHYYFKKSERPRPPDDTEDYGDSEVLENVMAQTPRDEVGILLNDKAEVLAPESRLWPETIARITASGPDGAELTATEERLLSKAPGQILRLAGELPQTWRPLHFVPGPKSLTVDTKLYYISLFLEDEDQPDDEALSEKDRRHFSVSRVDLARREGNKTKTPDYLRAGFGRAAAIICQADGSPVGVTVGGRIDLSGDGQVWRGPDVLADPGVNHPAGQEKLKEDFSRYLYQVKVTFRPPPEKEDEYDSGSTGFRWSQWRGAGQEEKELYLYGLAVAPDRLLVPVGLPRETAAAIDTLSVQVNGAYASATFTGVLKQCDATVITLKEAKLPAVLSLDPAVDMPKGQPLWTVYARELAGKDLVINYSRWFHKKRGDQGKWFRQLEHDVRDGSWLLTSDGRLAGLYTSYKREFQRLMPYLQGEGFERYASRASYGPVIRHFSGFPYYSSYGPADMNLFDVAALAAMLQSLPENLDKHVRHLTREEQKKRVWLGVEYTQVTREIAERLNLRRQTQDGRLGLMINRVYPHSPAAAMGIVEGDVLLKVGVPEAPWPIELTSHGGRQDDGPDYSDADIPPELERMGFQAPRKRPWPDRENPLTAMLLVIDEGTTVQLTYVHEGQEAQKSFTVEAAPPDSFSARKYKNEKLGLTVKDLTYEVRSALKLPDQEKAIVVSKVEPGTPAALARINRFELIRAVDGEEVAGVDDFEAAIAKAQKEKRPSARITVEWMGRTRLADLKFEAQPQGLKGMLRNLIPGGGATPQTQEPDVE